jgi:hypothetical protein
MKSAFTDVFILGLTIFFSFSAEACPDLSGQYEFTSSSAVHLTISQNACESIAFTTSRPPYTDSFTITYLIDGKNYQEAYYAAVHPKLNVNWTTPGLADDDSVDFHHVEFVDDQLVIKQFHGSPHQCSHSYNFTATQTCYLTVDNFQLDPLDPSGRTLIKTQVGYFRDGKSYSSDETQALKVLPR